MSQTKEMSAEKLPILTGRESHLVQESAKHVEYSDAGILAWGRKLIKINRNIGRLIVEDQHIAMREVGLDYTSADVEAHYDGVMSGYVAICGYMSMIGFLRSREDLPHKYLRRVRRDINEMPVSNPTQLERVRQVRDGQAPIEEYMQIGSDIIDSSELAKYRAAAYLMTTPPLDAVLDAVAKKYGFVHDTHVDSFADGFGLGYENAIEMYVQSREEALMPNI